MPNLAPDGPLGTETKGILSPIGDPVGQVLDKTLRPTAGAVLRKVGDPPGEAAERVHNVARNQHKWQEDDRSKAKADKDLPGGERIGGKTQTGQNPLGL